MILFHASNIDFNNFDNKFIGSGGGSYGLGEGFYFTTEKNLASLYGNILYTVEIKEADIDTFHDHEYLVKEAKNIKIIKKEILDNGTNWYGSNRNL